ncbi:MAG: hypothetical protein HYU36_01380 [Planctomycetes bacterium]|nr:hypothetical protein [Planctomycetota bacterium]
MGRIRAYIQINGRKCWTLFDTGARNTYVIPEVARLLVSQKLPRSFPAALGGSTQRVREHAFLVGKIQGHLIATQAMVIGSLGRDEQGRPIEILLGALSMQQWGIIPLPRDEKLDLTHYPREFLEY